MQYNTIQSPTIPVNFLKELSHKHNSEKFSLQVEHGNMSEPAYGQGIRGTKLITFSYFSD